MSLALASVITIPDAKEYKVHLASWNQEDQPLDVFIRDREEWDVWNRWRSTKDQFNRLYIFSLIDFYPEPDIWLFEGIYRVLSRSPVSKALGYQIERVPATESLVGRLKVRFARPGRGRSLRMEKYLPQMVVSELLREPYAGERFPGYENINHDFRMLETIFRANRPDWKAALENVKGVYLIADKSNGQKYVGAAYGDSGVWSRWLCYIETGHGWNDELTRLIRKEGIDYARENFQVSLLEYRPMKTDDKVIIERENFWKTALLSRAPLGYNKN